MAEGPDAALVGDALRAAGEDPGTVSLSRIPGGASREVYLIESPAGRWVLRRDPPRSESFAPLAVECEILRAAVTASVPAPRPIRFEEDGGLFGGAGFLMEHVGGDSVPPRLLRGDSYEEARRALPAQLGGALARIHAIDPGSTPGIPAPTGDPAIAACEMWESEIDRVGEPLPAVEAGLRWLRLNPPPPAPVRALTHGDFRLGNFIVDDRGLAAVIDWELAHVGDPAEDIGWLVIRSWRFGNDELPVAGLGELGPLLSAYEAAGGSRPDRDRLRWWEAMGNVKWAVICARQAGDHLEGHRVSHELASLGRRICEPEWDLLSLIGDR